MTGVTLYNGSHRSIVTFVIGSQQVAMFYHASHTSSTLLLHFCHYSFCTFFTRLFINLTMCIRALFPKSDNHSWSCRTSSLEGATLHRMKKCKFLCGNPLHGHRDILPLGLRVLDAFLSFCCTKEFGDGFGCVFLKRLLTS